ncbi:MAG: hypothetical protein H8M99_07055 [Gloeobacteraceae cyanobacterium ES-bin-144]|nr:hypothetical protein [Verrucomicrobiales bacterium]
MSSPQPSPPQETPRSRWLAQRQQLLEDGAALHVLLKKANGAGEHLLVIEIGEAALAGGKIADRVPILQQMGRALAVLGSSNEARILLGEIKTGRADDAETLGLLARVGKDLAAAAATPAERLVFLREAQQYYESGYRHAMAASDRGGAAYCGVNAAALAVLIDDVDLAHELALSTLEQAAGDDGYYGVATRAEASMILGKNADAEVLYQAAATLAAAENRWADLASTRTQCRELSLKLHGRRDHVDAAFPCGAVAVISAESLKADQTELEPELSADVERRVSEWAATHSVRSVFSGARPGWDLTVLEKLQDSGVETHLILPCTVERFVELVLMPKGAGWAERFESVRAKSVSVTILHEISTADPADGVEFTERMIAARGALLANHLGFALRALLISEQLSNTSARLWTQANLALHVIHPENPALDGAPDKDAKAEPVPFARALKPASAKPKVAVCAILLLNFPKYSAMSDDDFTRFQTDVLGIIATKLALSECPPINRQGFGGNYLLVFDQLFPAAAMALSLIEALRLQNDNAVFQPSICLHAGPVWQMINPILNLYAHEGAAITRAAALAGGLPAGVVYATETFTALSALESLRGVRFEHAGISVVDGYGDRLFRVHST